jgi:hypothetical protein
MAWSWHPFFQSTPPGPFPAFVDVGVQPVNPEPYSGDLPLVYWVGTSRFSPSSPPHSLHGHHRCAPNEFVATPRYEDGLFRVAGCAFAVHLRRSPPHPAAKPSGSRKLNSTIDQICSCARGSA